MTHLALLCLLFQLSSVNVNGDAPCTDASGDAEHNVTAVVARAATQLLAETFPAYAPLVCVAVRDVNLDTASHDALSAAFVTIPSAVPKGTTRVHLHTADVKNAGWATVYVSHFDTLAVLVERKESGDALGITSIAPALHDVTRNGHQYVRYRDLVQAINAGDIVAAGNLRAGSLVRVTATRARPLLQRGATIHMILRRGEMAVQIPVVTRDPASAGDEIRVHSPEFRTSYRVVILNSSLAQWVATL